MSKGPFVKYEEVPPESSDKRLTKVWHIWSLAGDDWLGTIRWLSAWRRYIFMPSDERGLMFDSECLRDIAQFLDDHKGDRV